VTARAVLCTLLLCGCALFRDRALDTSFEYEESTADVPRLESQLAEADDLYREPRSIDRVRRSLEIYLRSISAKNHYDALWRAARACMWLADHRLEGDARIEIAFKGVSIAEEATRRSPNRAEAHYYHGLCLGTLSRLEGGGLRRVKVMEAAGLRVIELDEAFEYAGGHRFLGMLYGRTKDHPLAGIGSFEEAVEHLERAHELFPGYAYNGLALAEVLISEEEEPERSRALLEEVLGTPPPPDRSADHARWVARARDLLESIP
jgi:tetratricopeptide (TPR) repeat protein